MKQILRLFAVVGVVLLTALISAGSCDNNDDGDKNKNNNSGGTVIVPPKVTPVAAVAKVKDKTIYLKASAFPATAAGTAAQHFADYNGTANANTKAFDVEIDKATGGMIVVANGDIKGATDLTTPAAGAVPTDATGDKGVHVNVNATGAAVGTLGSGANIFSVFADKTAAAADTVDAKKAPFAFSAEGSTANDTQPILWCVSTITGIAATGKASESKLTGGQKAACYVASVGVKSIKDAAAATAWFAKAAPFKREIGVSIAGVRTDDTTLDKIGLAAPAGTADAAKDQAIVTAFTDGVNKDEMKAIVETAAKNGLATHVPFAAYTIKVVKDTDFDAVK